MWPWQRRQSTRAANEIRALLGQLVEPRYRVFREGAPPAQQDILQAFMEARDPLSGRPFDLPELVNQVAMLFLAGHETSASALTWACLLYTSPSPRDRTRSRMPSSA